MRKNLSHVVWSVGLSAVLVCGCGSPETEVVMAESIETQVGTEPEMDGPSPSEPLDDLSGLEETEPSSPVEPEQTPEPQSELSDADRALTNIAAEWLIGTFDSSEQAARQPAYRAVQLVTCEVDAPALGERVLYVEQAMMTQVNSPYRQRLYVLEPLSGERVLSRVFSLVDPAIAVGLCERPDRVSFSANEVREREGCAVTLAWNATHFSGGTSGSECRSTLQGAQYATSEVTLHGDRLLSWDQGFNANGQQVWGATEGPYEFSRRSDANGGAESPAVEDVDAGVDNEEIPVIHGGERCDDAVALNGLGQPLVDPEAIYTRRMIGAFGASNDYNPLETSGLAPGCSLVYDANGHDVVFGVRLNPGDTFHARLQMEVGMAGGMYFLDACDAGTWPDIDESGLCGRSEYRSHGNCDFNDCRPLEWTFTWPTQMNGEPTGMKDLYLVIDQVIGSHAELFQLDWVITEAE